MYTFMYVYTYIHNAYICIYIYIYTCPYIIHAGGESETDGHFFCLFVLFFSCLFPGGHHNDTRESEDDRKIQSQSFAPANRGPRGQPKHTTNIHTYTYIYIYIYISIYDSCGGERETDSHFFCLFVLFFQFSFSGGKTTTTHESQKTTGKFRVRVLLRRTEGPEASPSTLPTARERTKCYHLYYHHYHYYY